MAAAQTYNDIIKRVSDGYAFDFKFYYENQNNMVQMGNSNFTMSRIGYVKTLPSLPSGVNSYKLLGGEFFSNTQVGIEVAKMVLLGTLNLATNVFTDGGVMPTQNGIQLYSTMYIEVLSPTNATPGNVTITFNDRNGASVSSGSVAMGASAPIGSGGVIPAPGANVGVTDVTNMVQSGGTTPSGIIAVYGLINLGTLTSRSGTSIPNVLNNLTHAFNYYPLGAGDKIGVFRLGSNVGNAGMGRLIFLGDT